MNSSYIYQVHIGCEQPSQLKLSNKHVPYLFSYAPCFSVTHNSAACNHRSLPNTSTFHQNQAVKRSLIFFYGM